jgi:tetratricopeptide (TPR) repeat protein
MEEGLTTYEEQDYRESPGREIPDNQLVEEEIAPVIDETGAAEGIEPAKSIFAKAIRWLVYAAAFLLPLWFLPWTADILDFNKQVLLVGIAAVGLVLYLLDVIKSGFLRYRPNPFYLPLAAMVLAGAAAVIFSVNRWDSVFGSGAEHSWSLVSLISFAALFFLAVGSTENKGRNLRAALTVSLALALLYGTLQMLGLYILPWQISESAAFNSIGSLNALAVLAAVSLVLFTARFSEESETLRRRTSGEGVLEEEEERAGGWKKWAPEIFRYAGFLSALFIVILTNWWPVWTIAFVSLLISVAFNSVAAKREEGSKRRITMKSFALPMAIIVLGIFLMLVNFNWTSIKANFPIEVAPSQKTSLAIALESLKQRPLGYGLENFAIAYDKNKPSTIAGTIFYQVRFTGATSETLNMAVEGGALMILAFLALLWFYGREIVSQFRNRFFGDAENGKVWAASLGLLTAFFLYPMNMTMLLVLVLILVLGVAPKYGSGLSGSEEKTLNLEKDAKYSFIGSVAFVVGLVLALVAGYFTVNNYIGNVYLGQALRTDNIDRSIDLLVKSANASPQDGRVYNILSQRIVAKLANDLQTGPGKDESRDDYNARMQNLMASAVNIALRATDVNAADAQNWFNRGFIYQNLAGLVGGADQAAISMFNESLKRNPSDPQVYLSIGNVYLVSAENTQRFIANPPREQVGKFDVAALRRQIDDSLSRARENFEKAIGLNNNFGQALYNLAVVYDREGKLPEAIRQFEKLQTANQRDPSILFQLGLLYYRNNQKDNAVAAWQRAVLLFPNYSNARWYLSLVLEERGDLSGALAQVQEIEKLNPDNELVLQRLEQLEAGIRTIPPEKVLEKKPLD